MRVKPLQENSDREHQGNAYVYLEAEDNSL